MTFLVDNQLPPALARFISEDLGGNALHVHDVGLRDASDEAVWSYAKSEDLILISKDEDFVTLHFKTPSMKLLWVRLGNCRRLHLLKVFEAQWPRITSRFESGDVFVELR